MIDFPTAWAFVPARGGSKSVRLKNLAKLAGHPLMSYGIWAAKRFGHFGRIVCSTDNAEIAEHALSLGIELDARPVELASDDAAVADVAREFLARQSVPLPELLVLVQPTSPFLKPEDISQLLEAMAKDPECQSGHNVAAAPHNFHPWNSRKLHAGRVTFNFLEERMTAYNKQRKPKIHFFGNLVAARCHALLRGENFFASPMSAVEINWPDNFDVDQVEDFAMAEALVSAGLARLVEPE